MLPSGNGVLVNGASTVRLPAQPADTRITIGSVVATVDASDVVVQGTTLRPGGVPVTVGGEVVSFVSGALVVGGSSTVVLPVWAMATGGMPVGTGMGTATWRWGGGNATGMGITPFMGGGNGAVRMWRGGVWVAVGVGVGVWLGLGW